VGAIKGVLHGSGLGLGSLHAGAYIQQLEQLHGIK